MRTVPPHLRELAAKVAAQRSPASGWERFRRVLGPEQLALAEDRSLLVAACTGRRAGKTTSAIGRTLRCFGEHSDARVAYFGPSDRQAVRIIWDDLIAYNQRFSLGLQEAWSDKIWRQGNRSLEIFGFYSRRDVNRARGRKFHLVIVDEAQLGPDWFASFVMETLAPAMLDWNGQIMLLGTPGEAADGYFFDACHDPDADVWSNGHHWTAAQNPFFFGRDPLAEARARFKLAEDNVTYKREWLGQWVVDPDALVYYIPDAAIRSVPAGTSWYGHVTGLDLGWKDPDAIAVTGVEELRQWSHLRHMEVRSKQTNTMLFRRLVELQQWFPGPVVFDPAGHGVNKTIETFRVDAPQITWVAAEKTRKVEFIYQLNNDLRSGTTFVEPASPMIKESRRVRWKRPGVLAKDAGHTDPGDAYLYGWRRARDMLRALPERPPPKSEDPFEEHMRRMREQQQNGGDNASYLAKRMKELS